MDDVDPLSVFSFRDTSREDCGHGSLALAETL